MTLFVVRAIYLGSEPMGELLDGENGSDAVQVPLKRTILRTEGVVGDEVDIIITDDSMCINYIKSNNKLNDNGKLIQLPIETLAYCGALRQLPPESIKDREFETLDKTPADSKSIADPPLFVTIFRSLEKENTLLCHSFVIRKDAEAMELVKNVMQVYYHIIEQLEQTEALFNGNVNIQQQQQDNNQYKINIETISNDLSNKSQASLTQAELDRLLQAYNRTGGNDSNKSMSEIGGLNTTTQVKQSILSNNGFSQFLVDENNASAKDVLLNQAENQTNFNASQYKQIMKEALNEHVGEYSNIPLNQDEDPIIIKKKNEEKLIYKQNVYIRWLQPPTPPPPAPIISTRIEFFNY